MMKQKDIQGLPPESVDEITGIRIDNSYYKRKCVREVFIRSYRLIYRVEKGSVSMSNRC
jgi:hypothetical protein